MNPRSVAILVASASAVGACGNLTGASYRGASLATVSGQLILNPGTQINAPIHVALVWTPFPDYTSAAGSEGKSVVAQDVPAVETFPINFSFDITAVPPSQVFGDLSQIGGTGRAARGFLVAYEDLNNNGTLDLIPPGGKPIDRILGASINPLNAEQGSIMLQYSDGTPPAYQQGVTTGFTLLNPNSVPFSTMVPIYLTDAGPLDWLVCEQVLISDAPDANDVCQRAAALRVRGTVGTKEGAPFTQLVVTDANFPWDDKFIVDAAVLVNGLTVPYQNDPVNPGYGSLEVGLTAAGRTNAVHVQEAGYPDVTFNVPAVGNFALTSPSEGGPLSVGTPIDMSWTASTGATVYQVQVLPDSSYSLANGASPAVLSSTGTWAALPALAASGTVYVEVDAQGTPAQDVFGSLIQSICGQTQTVDVSGSIHADWALAGPDPSLYQLSGQPMGIAEAGLVLTSNSASLLNSAMATTIVDARAFVGQRVRLHGALSTENAGFGGMWLQVTGADNASLGLDNMWNRGLTGTQAPGDYAEVLDVPAGAVQISYGTLLAGTGTVTATGLGLEVVSTSVPLTDTVWRLAGANAPSYEMVGDPTGAAADSLILSSGSSSAVQVGAVLAEVNASPYVGCRVRVSGTVRTQNVQGKASLWMTASPSGTQPLVFNDLNQGVLTGTTAAAPASFEINVPSDATVITYGVVLDGTGEVTVSNLLIEVVEYLSPLTR